MAVTMSTSNSLHPYPPQRSPTSSTSDHTTTPTSPHFASAQIQHAHIRSVSRGTNHTNTPPLHHASSSQTYGSTLERSGTPPVLNPPNGSPFASYLRGWTNADIASWLATFGCGHLGDLFRQHDIDGKVLLDLDMASLKEMGIQKVGERVKVLSGIKDLRKRVSASPSLSRVELRLNGAATPPLLDDTRGLERSGSRRLHSTRPPPLDLQAHSSSRNLPQAYQANGGPSSSQTERATTPRAGAYPGRPTLASQISNTNYPSSHGASTTVPAPSRPGNLNLRAPPSRDQGRHSPSPVIGDAASFADRPLPPAPGYSSAQDYASSYGSSRGATTPTPGWSNQAYGLPRGPAPAPDPRRTAAAGSSSVRSGISPEHRKSPSITNFPSASRQSPSRSAFGQAYSSTSSARISPHPFAARSHEGSPPPDHRSNLGHNRQGSGYAAQLPRGAVRKDTSSSASSAPLSLEDLRKQLVKFVNAEDGTMKTVNVSSCVSGVEVLERVLKKFNKWNPSNVNTESESDEDGERLEVDGWGVYIDNDPESRPLSESALLQVCLSHRDGSRYVQDRGLVLKCTRKTGNRKNMGAYLGEGAPPMSPASPTTYFGGPRLSLNPGSPEVDLLTPSRSMGSISSVAAAKKTNRASIVSVMSGLGVPMADAPPSPSSARSPGTSFLPSRKKMYNFFGHRPPSELISSHLAEYFPSAKKKELEKTVRHSMRLSVGRRSSAAPSIIDGYRLSGDSARPSPPRRRPTSRSTLAISPPSGSSAIPEEQEYLDHYEPLPRMSVSNDSGQLRRPVIDGESEDESVASVESKPPLLPPFESSKESLMDSLGAYSPSAAPRPRPKSAALSTRRGSGGSSRSRLSMLSQFRRNRDRADNVSLLTVDEITAEVEHRRASTITFEDSDEEEEAAEYLGRPAVLDQILPQSEDEEDDADHSDDFSGAEGEEESSSEEESSEGEEESDEEDKDHGKAFTSTGSKRIIKWIKGALIGAGSFGSVFLGMDAHSGLLMAVKQVDLPTGGRSEEKKKSMVDALEREIELLKELQHENIVQYLDSSADGAHLNIFLEYVPGGSVAALLNNYGAFEEALVRNFVRQILTGLNYLHEREIIHRDIKGANILVDNKGGIKISDFGISKKVENNLMHGMRTNRPSLQGSVFWMAPEIVKQTSYTSKADIWSVGCLVVEMLTGTHPWADLTQMQAIFRIGSSARPSNPSDISLEAADFLNRSFEIEYTARPTAAELLDHQFISELPGNAARGSTISVAQAKASMAAAHANAQKGMAMMGAART